MTDVSNVEDVRIKLVSVDELIPYVRNARTHSQDQVAKIAGSIKEFGFTNPILVDGSNGIIAGHGRLAAARLLGLKRVPAIELGHLSDAQKRAYIIADNRLALDAGWDLELLRAEFADLQTEGFDLSMTGFTDKEIAEIMEPGVEENGKDPDDAPPPPPEPHSKLGDTWILGPHRVRCGDSTSVTDWDALLGDELVDAVWTDPPYNVAYGDKADALSKATGAKGARASSKILNDDMDDAAFLDFLRGFYSAVFTKMKPGAAIYVAHADTEGLNFRRAFAEAGFKLASCLIWRKNSLVLGRSDWQWIHEPILYGWKPGSSHRWYGGRKQVTVNEWGNRGPVQQGEDGKWRISVGDTVLVVDGSATIEESPGSIIYADKPKANSVHPTMKPVELIEKMLKFSARGGDIVADAFGGSGSTLMAAERLGMCARLMELSPAYVDVICRRWAQYTGRVPVHADTGAKFPV